MGSLAGIISCPYNFPLFLSDTCTCLIPWAEACPACSPSYCFFDVCTLHLVYMPGDQTQINSPAKSRVKINDLFIGIPVKNNIETTPSITVGWSTVFKPPKKPLETRVAAYNMVQNTQQPEQAEPNSIKKSRTTFIAHFWHSWSTTSAKNSQEELFFIRFSNRSVSTALAITLQALCYI